MNFRNASGVQQRNGALHTLSIIAFVLMIASQAGRTASQHAGQVTIGTVPVPGATVTASQGDTQVVASTDENGVYTFGDLADGVWTLRIEMVGFVTVTQDVTVAPDSPPAMWQLTLRPFADIAQASASPPSSTPPSESPAAGSKAAAPSGAPASPPRGFQRAGVSSNGASAAAAAAASPPAAPAGPPPPAADSPFGAAEGLLVNGSVNNGAASPFAQLAAFGNNRRGGRSLYNGSVGGVLGSSVLDAETYSLSG
ncbi:MAG TPA: carboxypeptidase-like regulatory domain-containing protein, partial [Vicinamibacterales bacterium]|nr:carboxypeptidase-like regulatory domain-containing protein [Vicinamibacterales bacterium]